MNKKVCGRCGNYYDENLVDCPFCNSNNNGFNITNQFLNTNNNVEEQKAPIINNNIVENKETIIGNSNNSFDKFEGLNKISYEKSNSPKSNIIMEQKIEEAQVNTNNNEIIKNNHQAKKRKKKNKINELFSFLLLIQGMILLFIVVLSAFTDFNLIILCHYVITSFLLTIAFNFCYRNKKIGIILSLIASISMICMFLEGDYISAVIGVYILTFSFVSLIRR